MSFTKQTFETAAERRVVDLIIGPYRTGKTLLMIDEIIAVSLSDPLAENIVLVPSQRYKNLLLGRIAAQLTGRRGGDELAGLCGLRILSFYQLCQRILRGCGASHKLIPDKVRPALIQKVLNQLSEGGNLDGLGPIVHYAGTHRGVLDLIDEFERAAISPADLIEQLETSAHTASKQMELAQIYQSYWQELERIGFIDQRGLAFRLREVLSAPPQLSAPLATSAPLPPAAPLPSAPLPSVPHQAPAINFLAVDGFDRFNALQIHVLSSLIPYVTKMTLCFDYAPPDSTHASDYLWKESSYTLLMGALGGRARLRHAGDRSGREDSGAGAGGGGTGSGAEQSIHTIAIAPIKRRRTKTVNAGVVQLNLFVDAAERLSEKNVVIPDAVLQREPAAIKKVVCLDRFFEMEEIARQVKDRLLTQNTHADDMLVVVRNVRQYQQAIHAAFEKAGLSYFIDETVELASLPIIQFLLLLVSLSTRGFRRRDVLQLLRSPYFDHLALGMSAFDIERADELSIDQQVVAGVEQWAEIGRKDAQLSALLASFFERCAPQAVQAGMQPVENHVKWCEDLLELLLVPFDDDWRDLHQLWEEQQALNEFKKLLASLMLEQQILDASQEAISFDSFVKRLRHLVERANFRRIPRTREYITICSAELAPNRLYEHIFIAGMVEGEFPRRSGQSGFVGADELARWSSFGVELDNPRHHPAFEPALFNSLIQRARQSVHLSCPAHEITGEELMPSFLLTRGEKRAFDSIERIAPCKPSQARGLSARDAVGAWLWCEHDADSAALLVRPDTRELIESIQDYIAAAKARALAVRDSPFNGYLSDLVLSGALRVDVPQKWSATRLSDYGRCPFRFWVSHVLRVEPFEEPEMELSARLLGRTYHKAFENFYQVMAEKNKILWLTGKDVYEPIFDEAVGRALRWLETQPEVRKGEFWQYQKNEIIFRMQQFLAAEVERGSRERETFVPFLMESGFGMDEAGPPALVIKSPRGDVVVRGQVDRIDVSLPADMSSLPAKTTPQWWRGRVRVVDYKSSARYISKDDAITGRNLQLPLYALAVQRSILPGSQVVQGRYLSFGSGRATGSLYFARAQQPQDAESDAELAEVIEEDVLAMAERHVLNFVDGVASGDFSIRPNGTNVCKDCIHKTICRIREGNFLEANGGTQEP